MLQPNICFWDIKIFLKSSAIELINTDLRSNLIRQAKKSLFFFQNYLIQYVNHHKLLLISTNLAYPTVT